MKECPKCGWESVDGKVTLDTCYNCEMEKFHHNQDAVASPPDPTDGWDELYGD